MPETYTCHLDWTGAAAGPTVDAGAFSRDLQAAFPGGSTVPMSAAPGYKGDAARVNPEQMLVASLSACQALFYLFLAARKGIQVVAYTDDPEGKLGLVDGRMRMTTVTLRPHIRLAAGADENVARELIEKAHEQCFIANSVTSKVVTEPTFQVG